MNYAFFWKTERMSKSKSIPLCWPPAGIFIVIILLEYVNHVHVTPSTKTEFSLTFLNVSPLKVSFFFGKYLKM